MTDQAMTELQRELVPMFINLSESVPPRVFHTFFVSLVANIVGNLPDEYWERVRQAEPCSIQGCNCHVTAQTVMNALDNLRDDHKKTMEERDNARAE